MITLGEEKKIKIIIKQAVEEIPSRLLNLHVEDLQKQADPYSTSEWVREIDPDLKMIS